MSANKQLEGTITRSLIGCAFWQRVNKWPSDAPKVSDRKLSLLIISKCLTNRTFKEHFTGIELDEQNLTGCSTNGSQVTCRKVARQHLKDSEHRSWYYKPVTL